MERERQFLSRALSEHQVQGADNSLNYHINLTTREVGTPHGKEMYQYSY